MVTFFVTNTLSEKRQRRLDANATGVKQWAFLLLFAAAASPIPDELIVVPLGLMKYSPAKFFSAFFLGETNNNSCGSILGQLDEADFFRMTKP